MQALLRPNNIGSYFLKLVIDGIDRYWWTIAGDSWDWLQQVDNIVDIVNPFLFIDPECEQNTDFTWNPNGGSRQQADSYIVSQRPRMANDG